MRWGPGPVAFTIIDVGAMVLPKDGVDLESAQS